MAGLLAIYRESGVQVGDVFPPAESRSSRHYYKMPRAPAFGRRDHIPHLHSGPPMWVIFSGLVA